MRIIITTRLMIALGIGIPFQRLSANKKEYVSVCVCGGCERCVVSSLYLDGCCGWYQNDAKVMIHIPLAFLTISMPRNTANIKSTATNKKINTDRQTVKQASNKPFLDVILIRRQRQPPPQPLPPLWCSMGHPMSWQHDLNKLSTQPTTSLSAKTNTVVIIAFNLLPTH